MSSNVGFRQGPLFEGRRKRMCCVTWDVVTVAKYLTKYEEWNRTPGEMIFMSLLLLALPLLISSLFLYIFICLMSWGVVWRCCFHPSLSEKLFPHVVTRKNIILRSLLFLSVFMLFFLIPNIFDVVIMPYLICFDDITREFRYYHLWDITCDTASNKIRLNEYGTFVEFNLTAQPACIASGCSPLMKW